MRTSLEEGIKLHRFAGIFPEQFMTEAGRHREPPSPTVLVVPEDEKLKIHSRSIDEGRARLVLPLFLALPAHRLARRVLRLEPRLRRPAAIGRILRHDALQPHAADMLEHGWAVTRQMFIWMARRLALPSSLASRRLRSISGRSRRSST